MRPLLTLLATVLALFLAAPSQGKDAAPPGITQAGEVPPKVHEFLSLMNDQQVRAWLIKEIDEQPVGTSPGQQGAEGNATGLGEIDMRIELTRAHFAALAMSIPTLPEQLGAAKDMLASEFKEHAILRILSLLALFVGLGRGVEWLVWRATAQLRGRVETAKLDTVGQRLQALGMRFGLGIGLVVSFALGSVAAFLAFRWPPLLRQIILGYLVAALALRLAIVIGRFFLAPGGKRSEDVARFRVVPMATSAARYWFKRLVLIVGWTAFGWVTIMVLSVFGLSREALELFAYALGLVLLALAIEAVWRAPSLEGEGLGDAVEPTRSRRARAVWLSLYFVALWLLWVAGAMAIFWVAVLVAALPAALKLTERAVNHILRPPGTEEAKAGATSLAAVSLERGLRALLIIGAVLWLAHVWSVDVGDIATQNTLVTRALRAVLTAIIVILAADFLWNIAKAMIDAKIEEANSGGEVTIEEQRRRSRLRTLLPIARNMLFVFIFVLAAMMGLASLGVEIGPLIASAGVVGVAIGFGAQTVVKDVISGIFYLLDDAFRVGEYIQSGNYKGVVESFSLRSVKLRHQNGPLYTVPFGALGAVQNMSRDWVVEKLTIGVTYDTDIEKARRIVKKVGQELAQDPELAAGILEPLKMQGVQEFGDFAIQLRMKMKTQPGDVQFMARRRALAMIKRAFDENGIKFAYPTVQVAGGMANAGGEAVGGAIAQKGLELLKPAASG